MMKRFAAAIVLISLVALLCSCSAAKTRYVTYYFDYFDTVTEIVGYEHKRADFDAVCEEIRAELEKYHTAFDAFGKDGGVYAINECAGEWTDVSPELAELLCFAKEMCDLTRGETNVALGAVTSLWKSAEKTLVLPTEDALFTAGEHVSIDGLLIDGTRVRLCDKEARLDVGAVAKGIVLDAIAGKLRSECRDGYLINLGGSVTAIGSKPDGSGFVAGIENPRADATETYIATVKTGEKYLVTSGANLRRFSIGGKTYCHVIDADTLCPAEYFLSVSVLCDSAALGDALSTALFCMPLEDGEALIDSIDGAEAFWVTEDATYRSAGFPG